MSLKDYILESITVDSIKRIIAKTLLPFVKSHLADSISKYYKKYSPTPLPAYIYEKSSADLLKPIPIFEKKTFMIRLAKALMRYAVEGEEPENLTELERDALMLIIALIEVIDSIAEEELES